MFRVRWKRSALNELAPFPVGKFRSLLRERWCRKVRVPRWCSRPRWACPSGAPTGQLESAAGSHSASVGLVPTGQRLVG